MVYKVLVTCPHLQKTIDIYRERLVEKGIELEVPSVVQQLSEAELLEIIDRFDGVIAGDDPFTAKVLEKGKRLKIVAKWGIGVDGIDRDAANRLGILVKNTPDVFSDEVADVALGYIILLARHLHKLDQSVRSGGWLQIPGMTLRGKTLGVIGVGSIGRGIVKRGVAVGMSVLGYDIRSIPDAVQAEFGVKSVSFEELLQQSDFIALSCNLTPENHHLLSHQQFELMKPGVRLVNVARGPLIDETALVAALKLGKVAGAALDVFEVEPLPMDSPLRQFDQCIFGTHNSSHTKEAVLRVNELAIANLLQGLGVEGL
ncbi:phosphoglycerate dehydrogenase [Lyngbya sp. PCC 8106]|uniref:phosphoglycerate dehydrogenase n=1 Tax=Lyngbya sp. (strain PCC 8106) TaxID=313612 RepID=UPI0000EABC73|nr:phosphoglycerate dehydrogenase [Lyngbya sp. PCC 8106]EAW35608.1 D-isomer specific 2-hydroxyacid dehydrogenase family protein [Lyngbya sp. PCC 8106]